jgi:hypothetical protein
VTIRLIRLRAPEGWTTTSSPLLTVPPTTWPQTPRKFGVGRLTHWTGIRNGPSARRPRGWTACSQPISVGPSYHAVCSEGVVTLSPRSADTGIVVRLVKPSSATLCAYSSRIRSNTPRS